MSKEEIQFYSNPREEEPRESSFVDSQNPGSEEIQKTLTDAGFELYRRGPLIEEDSDMDTDPPIHTKEDPASEMPCPPGDCPTWEL